jgi:hypothetical protein
MDKKISLTDAFNQFCILVERESGFMASGLVLEEFSAKNPVHRLNIRLGIVESNMFTDEENKNLLDLNQRPKSHSFYFAISHSDVVGGYVQSDRVIGFDVERSERVLAKTIQRVSSEAEIAAAPAADFLWTAKEAVFKAVSVHVLSQIEITNWTRLNSSETFRFSCKPIEGLTLKHNFGFSQRFLDHNWTIFFF